MKKLFFQIYGASALMMLIPLGLFGTMHQTLSGLAGVALMAGNLYLLLWSWERIFLKKSIALAVSVIVFKYAILGAIIYIAMVRGQMDPIGFTIGLSTVVPAMVFFAFKNKEKLTRT